MNRDEIEKRIAEIKDLRFDLAMKDHWSREDSIRDTELSNEIRELEGRLNNE